MRQNLHRFISFSLFSFFFLASFLTGCFNKKQEGTTDQQTQQPSGDAGSFLGAGSSFAYPLYVKWGLDYQKTNPSFFLNYQGIGSGGGVRQLMNKTVDFGAVDTPLTVEELEALKRPVLHLPTALGAVVIAYNLIEIEEQGELRLDGPTLAKIFNGEIKKWDHPEIKKLNPSFNFPRKNISVVHRADGSGTTAIFSEYLSNHDTHWAQNVGKGKSLQWPIGIGAKGNQGVAGVIKQSEGSLGYIELGYAVSTKLKMAALKNIHTQEFVTPSSESISKAASMIKSPEQVLNSLLDSSIPASYPLSGFTYILLTAQNSAEKMKQFKDFLSWALTEGQKEVHQLHYAPLPVELQIPLLEEIKKFQ